MYLTSVPTLYLLWASLLSLQQGFVLAQNATTYDVCVTKRTSPSPHGRVSTKYDLYTISVPRDIFITTTPGKTITPAQATATSTVSTTTIIVSDVPQSTDTFTRTTTTTTTATVDIPTSTITDTVTQTSTITTIIDATTTIPTPAGFSPVIDTLPGSAAKKRSPIAGSLRAARGILQQPLCPPINKKPPPSWPAAVTCYGVVESFIHTTITKTARKTTTVTAPTPTTTVTTTAVLTSTDVITTPDASVTITVTKTQTTTTTNSPSTTTTTTTTTTVVVPIYTATAYAMCAPGSNNYAGTLDNAGIDSANQLSGLSVASSNNGESSAAACCNSCAANPLCAGTGFYGGAAAGLQCFVFISAGNSCSPVDFEALYSPVFAPDSGYIISNGNCGVYNEAAES